MKPTTASIGVIIVDHGSRRSESNQLLEEVARQFAERFAGQFSIVEAAHMELAEPSIATAFGRCVSRGARHILVLPYFLGPGKHWTQDIPRLSAEAASGHSQLTFHVAPTLGLDALLLDLLAKRAGGCVNDGFDCDLCHGSSRQGKCPSIA